MDCFLSPDGFVLVIGKVVLVPERIYMATYRVVLLIGRVILATYTVVLLIGRVILATYTAVLLIEGLSWPIVRIDLVIGRIDLALKGQYFQVDEIEDLLSFYKILFSCYMLAIWCANPTCRNR